MKVTIIIPVYNAEKHLDECIQSVLKQNFEDFEILLINDGSTDASGIICDAYAAKDHRVKVFHKKNGGVSSARNLGLENAAGEWITFIDADDYIAPDYFKVLESPAHSDWIHLGAERNGLSQMGVGMNFENQLYQTDEFVKKYSLYPHFPEVWAKFFKRDIIKRNDLRFKTELKFGEDSLFNLKYLKHCQVITTSNLSEYIYKNDENGLSKLGRDVSNDTTLFNEIEHEIEQNQYPVYFCEQTISIPLMRYLRVLYSDSNLVPVDRRRLLKTYVDKYYNVVLTFYTDPKIRLFIVSAHLTGFYSLLDLVLIKLSK